MRAATTEKACFVEDTKLSTNKQHTLSLPVMCAPLRVPLEVLLLLFSFHYLYMCVCLFDGLLYQVINFIFIITIFLFLLLLFFLRWAALSGYQFYFYYYYFFCVCICMCVLCV